MFATVKSALMAANEKWEASCSYSNEISVFGLMYRPTSYLLKLNNVICNIIIMRSQ